MTTPARSRKLRDFTVADSASTPDVNDKLTLLSRIVQWLSDAGTLAVSAIDGALPVTQLSGVLPESSGGTGESTYTDGQLLIGNTATGALNKATITAGANITVTNGNGTVSIAAAAGGGIGNVTGPASAASGDIALFNGTTGKIIQDAGKGVPAGAIVGTTDAQTLSSKTLTLPTITDFSNATHTHQNATGGGTLDAAAIASGQLALTRGGTGSDLSGTGGTHQVLRQSTAGASVTVSQLAAADVSGLAASATTDTTNAANISSGTLPAGRLPALTGDITTSIGTVAATLASVSSTSGTAGDASHVAQVTTNAKGLVTAQLSVAIVITPTAAGLSNVTNDAQTKAAVVPNTAPSAGQILVGNAGGTAYAPQTVGTDATLAATGALTIANGAVTLAKQANMATASLVYRKTAGSGAPEVNTLAALKTDLLLTGTNSGDQVVPANTTSTASNYFSAYNSTTGAFTKAQPAFTDISGSVAAAQMPALTGDITTSAGAVATTIGSAKVTNAMLAGSIAASKLVGSDIATVGTITTGTWTGTTIAVANGGTGLTTLASIGFTPTRTASTGTWTAGTVVGQYLLIGKQMTVWLTVTGSTVSATPTNLKVLIPASATAKYTVGLAAPFSDNGTAGTGWAQVTAGGTSIDIYKNINGTGNWATATTATAVGLIFAFEIQ